MGKIFYTDCIHMCQIFNKKKGFTLLELLVATGILMLMLGFVTHWFFIQRTYQQRLAAIAEIQENFRQASWNMIQELQMARVIIWPRMNTDNSMHSDNKVVFKDFFGRIVAYYHVPTAQKIHRCVIPNGPGNVRVDDRPLAKGIASASFTVSSFDNRLVSIHLSTAGIHALDAVYLLNGD